MTPVPTPSLIPIEEAARALQTTPLRLLMQLRRGELEGKESEGRWYLTRQSVAALRERGLAPLGGPSHCGKGTACGGCR